MIRIQTMTPELLELTAKLKTSIRELRARKAKANSSLFTADILKDQEALLLEMTGEVV